MLWRCILSDLRICVKVKVAILGFLSLIVPMVSMDVKQQWKAEFVYYILLHYVYIYIL